MKKGRLIYIDIIKIIAIVLVIMCHIPLLYGIDIAQEQLATGWITSIIIGCLGVPLFVMCTGVLVLRKKLESKSDIFTFYRNNLMSIYTTGCIWCLVYYFLSTSCSGEAITVGGVVKTALLIHKPEVHLWYIRMILIYYLAMPLLVYLLHKHKSLFLSIVTVVGVITFGKNGYEILINRNACPTTSGLSLSCYLVYLYIGYHLSCHNKNVSKNNLRIRIFLFLLMFAGGLISAVILRCVGWYSFVWYDNPFLLFSSVGLFALIMNIRNYNGISSKMITELSKMTFGVYLCHMIILLYCLPSILEYMKLPETIVWFIVMSMTLVASFGIVHVSHYIPKLSKILFRY